VKLRNVAGSLEADIPLIKTEDRLARHLKAKAWESHLGPRLASLASPRVEANAVLCLDLSDVRKEYAEKMEYLDQVWDGSEGEVHAGYWLYSVTAAEVQGSEITPLYQTLVFSTRARFRQRERRDFGRRGPGPSAHRRSRHLGHGSGRGSKKAVGATAGAERTLRHPLRGTAFGDQPTAPEGDGSPSGSLLPLLSYQRLRNLVLLVTAAAYFAATFPGQKLKLKILCEKMLIISQRFFGIPPLPISMLSPTGSRKFSLAAAPLRPPNRLLNYNLNSSWAGRPKKTEESPVDKVLDKPWGANLSSSPRREVQSKTALGCGK
jgi:hypothetical protein